MGPSSRKFWLPLVRLGAFFGAVVVVGNLVLDAAYTPGPSEQEAGASDDYLSKRKRQIEKRLRSIERFFFGIREFPIPAPIDGSGAIWMADPELVEVESSGAVRPVDAVLPGSLSAPEPAPAGEFLAFGGPPVPEPAIRLSMERSWQEPMVTSEFIVAFHNFGAPEELGGVGDALLRGPEALIDGLLHLATEIFPRSGDYAIPYNSNDSITDRMLDYDLGPRQGRIFSQFLGHLLEREQRYFSRFGDSELDTFEVQDGERDVSFGELVRDQGKVVWDALRKTYFSKYKFHGEDRVRDEAFYFNQWRGVDFLILPPLIAGYVYYRGLEKRFSLGETWARLTVEPISRWVSGKEDLLAGVSLEWGIKGFPVGVIVSAGRYDGKAALDFVGIGTTVGMVRKALALQRGE